MGQYKQDYSPLGENKKSQIKSVESLGTYDFNEKRFYKWEVTMENGDNGEVSTLDETHKTWSIGETITYDIIQNDYGTKLKRKFDSPFKPQNNATGGFKHNPNKERLIVKQTCLKAACDLSGSKNTSVSKVLEVADIFFKWVMNENNIKPKNENQDVPVINVNEDDDLPF